MLLKENSKANITSSVFVGIAALLSLLNFLLFQSRSFAPISLLALIPIGMLVYLAYSLYKNLNTDIRRCLTLFQIYFILVPVCTALRTLVPNLMYIKILLTDLLLALLEAAILFFPAILSIRIFKSRANARPLKIILIIEIILFALINIRTAVRIAASYAATHAAITPSFPMIPVLLAYLALWMIAKDLGDGTIS